MGICLICCWHGMNNQSNILFSFSFVPLHGPYVIVSHIVACSHSTSKSQGIIIPYLAPPPLALPHVQNKFLTYGLFVFNFRKMFYAFLIATDTTIKTERKVLSLPTKHFYVIPNKHKSFELDASVIDCRDQSVTTTQERKKKRWVSPRL